MRLQMPDWVISYVIDRFVPALAIVAILVAVWMHLTKKDRAIGKTGEQRDFEVKLTTGESPVPREEQKSE